jgi:Tol biopolymer transport system component
MTEAAAEPGDQSIVSLNENGEPAQGGYSAISGDGRYVVFDTYAALVAADTNGKTDIYLRDRIAGVTALVSVSSAGVLSNGVSRSARVSDDGNTVVFHSSATNLSTGDTNGRSDVFVRNLEAGETTLVSNDSAGAPAAGDAYEPFVSGDGRFVTFTSNAGLVPDDTNGAGDVYRRDLASMELDLVSELPDGSAGSGAAQGISEDGDAVLYMTYLPRDAADTNGQYDVYVRDFASNEHDLVSVGPNGESSNAFSGYAELSADGQHVTFSTQATTFGNPDNHYFDVFWHDRTTGETRMVSEAPNGDPQNGWAAHSSISGDGRYVAFHSTSTNLIPVEDPGLYAQIFVRDMQTGAFVLGSPTEAGQTPDGSSDLPAISADGRFVTFFGYNTHLVGSNGFRLATFVYEIDYSATAPPDVAINSGPDGPTGDADATFAFSSTDGSATFECSLVETGDPDDFAECTSPASYPGLADGDYVFKVRASNDSGLTSEEVSRSFSIDTTGPLVTLEGGPPALTNDNTPTLPFSAEPGTTFACSLTRTTDSFEPCTSPMEYPAQPDGVVTFKVLGTDALGNVGPLTESTFTIDASPASVDIVTAPEGTTNDNTPTFGFESEAGASFECSLSTGPIAYDACESPLTYDAQDDGEYTFQVRANDGAGNVGPASVATFTIDTTAPATNVDVAPLASSSDDSPSFEFSSESGATFECSLTTGAAAFEPCQSPAGYTGLAADDYVFSVRATDGAGNVGAASSYAFTIETDVEVPAPSTPDLTAASDTGLSATDNITADATPTLTGTAPAGSTVSILVDGTVGGSALTTADGGFTVTTASLPLGTRSIAAVATDEDGNASPASAALSVSIVQATACHTATNRINGTATANTLTGARLADLIFGLGGNDTVDGRTNNDCVVGGSGNDQLRGGVGNDELVGDDGTDTLALGDGVDTASGGAGNDRITARDGAADLVDCGAGAADIAIVDNLDSVVNCETVRVG